MSECEHKFIHLETQKTHAESASFGLFPGVNWKRVDIFYCEKCLQEKQIVKTAPWYQDRPEWF